MMRCEIGEGGRTVAQGALVLTVRSHGIVCVIVRQRYISQFPNGKRNDA